MDSPAADLETQPTEASPHKLPDNLVEELRGVVGLLLGYMLDHAGRSDETGKTLVDVKETLQRAEEPAEVLAARERIAELLTTLAPNTLVQNKEDRPPAGDSSPVDTATGLPLEADAKEAIRRALAGATPTYLAVFSVERIALISSRFGDAVADQVMMLCSQHLASRLIKPTDALFRWKGPSFAALLERSASSADTSAEVQRFLAVPTNQYFDLKHRTVYMPIKMTGEVVALAGQTYEEAMDKAEQLTLVPAQNTVRNK